jgi:hypothetical protein
MSWAWDTIGCGVDELKVTPAKQPPPADLPLVPQDACHVRF